MHALFYYSQSNTKITYICSLLYSCKHSSIVAHSQQIKRAINTNTCNNDNNCSAAQIIMSCITLIFYDTRKFITVVQCTSRSHKDRSVRQSPLKYSCGWTFWERKCLADIMISVMTCKTIP